MTLPLLETKFHIPHRPQETAQTRLVHRPRLWEKLEAGRRRKLTLVSAPVGFGKTTLVAEWIHHAAIAPVAWLTLDAEDNDPARIFAYLLAALQSAAPALSTHLAAATQTPSTLPPESLLALIVNAISRGDTPLTLVLDDYHVIEAPAVHAALRSLLDHMPPTLHLILSTRSDPPIPLARLRARQDMVDIRAADLSFTADEAQRFFAQVMQLPLDADSIATLTARTEGWAAGLQLAALYLADEPDPARAIHSFGGSHAYIIDFLVEEVLARQPEERKQFLLKTSILDRLCAPLADAVTGRHDGQAMLEALDHANLFLIPLDGERRWYRYHHLFAATLRRLLEQSHPHDVPNLHEWAAVWFEMNGFAREAVQHAFASGDLDHAAALLSDHADALIARGEFATLADWLNRLPDDLLVDYPRLVLARAECFLFFHDLVQAEVALGLIDLAASAAGTLESKLQGKAAITRADIALNRGDLAAAIAHCEDALTVLAAGETQLRARALMLQGAAYVWSGRYEDGCRAYAASAQLAIAAEDMVTAIYAIGNHARALLLRGQPRQGLTVIQRAFDFAAAHQMLDSLILAGCFVVRGELHCELDQLDAAAADLDEGLRRAQLVRNPRTLLSGYRNRLRLYAARDQAAAVAETVAQVNQLIAGYTLPPAMIVGFHLTEARHWLRQGDLDRVEAWLTVNRAHLSAQPSPDRIDLDILAAQLHHARKENQPALRLVDTLLELRSPADTLDGVLLALLKSQILCDEGNESAGLPLLRATLRQCEVEGIVRTVVEMGPSLMALIQRHQNILRDGAHAPSAAFLVQVVPLPLASAPLAFSPLLEPLTDREREVLLLVQEGLSDSQIAARLIVAVGTVKRHLNNIYGKLGVRSRTQALARARELGVV